MDGGELSQIDEDEQIDRKWTVTKRDNNEYIPSNEEFSTGHK